MNNSEDFKTKYLKYKRDYLNLKEELEGGETKLSSAEILYVILDKETYELIKTIIKRSILSIQFIDTILAGSALKITEGSNIIKFLQNDVVGDTWKHYRRTTKALVGISLPPYQLKENVESSAESKSWRSKMFKPGKDEISHLKEPYKQGQKYNNSSFIENITAVIGKKLNKRSSNARAHDFNLKSYESIPDQDKRFNADELPFYAVISFASFLSGCIFLSSYILTEYTGEDAATNPEVGTIQTGPYFYVYLKQDTTIYSYNNAYSTYIQIKESVR